VEPGGCHAAPSQLKCGPLGVVTHHDEVCLIKREWSLLFNEYDLRALLEAEQAKAAPLVRKLLPAAFDAQSDEFLAARIASELVVAPIALDENGVQVSTKDVKVDVSHDFSRVTNPYGPTYVDGLEVTYHLPFAGDQNLLRCRPSTFTTAGARAVVASAELRFPYDSADRDVLATKRWFNEDLGRLRQWLGWVNQQVEEYNHSLEPAARRLVAARRSDLARTIADVEALGYPIRTSRPEPAQPTRSREAVQERRIVKRQNDRRKYDVALSFAGEDRAYVEAVASALVAMGVEVFYDRFEQVNLWGKDLADHLGRVYGEDARFTVLFASRRYAAKAWPNHEKSHALGRHLRGDQGRILPVRLDDTAIPGLPPTISYLDLRALTPEQLAELIRQKLDVDVTDA